MNILLINPPYWKISGNTPLAHCPSLGLSYIGAVLEKKGYIVTIIDIDTENISNEDFKDIIRNKYDIVGITATTPTIGAAIKYCRLVKEHSNNTTTILGGVHPTIMPEECLSSPYVDFVVRGEAEATILELIDVIEHKGDYSYIQGVSFKNGNGIVHTARRTFMDDLDSIPFPAIHLFRKWKYTLPDSLHTPVFPIMTSRGCPYPCTYCCSKMVLGRAVRMRSPQNVVNEIEYLVTRYGAKVIDIIDDVFTADKKRVFAIAEELKKRRLKLNFCLSNGIRVDNIDGDTLECLKDMGVYRISYGVESGSQIILNKMRKKITLDQVERAFTLTKKYKIESGAFFIVGHPGETQQTLEETRNFILKIDPDIIHLFVFRPFPGTEAYRMLQEEGSIVDGDYTHYNICVGALHDLPNLSREEIIYWQKKIYREFYLRPIKMIKTLSTSLKSWQRLKVNSRMTFQLFRFARYLYSG